MAPPRSSGDVARRTRRRRLSFTAEAVAGASVPAACQYSAMDKVSKKVDKKMREAGWLSPGEEVRIGVVTFPLGNTKGGGGTATPTGVVTDLLVVGPLQRKLGKALYGDEDKDVLAELVPEKVPPPPA